MKIELENKNILVTGGSYGLGRAIALELATQGAHLFVIARNAKKLKELQKEINIRFPNCRCEVYAADVSNPQKIELAIKNMHKKMGKIDGIINNAGIAYANYFEKTSHDVFENIIKTNVLGSVYVTQAAYPFLTEGGFVSFVSSVAGFMGVFGYSAYSSSKFAIIGLAETLSQEFLPKKISVSVLCPPDTATPGFEQENKDKPAETRHLADSAGILSPEGVAQKYLKKLVKGKFFITVNFESWLFYRLHGIMPSLVRKVMFQILLGFYKKQKKKEEKNTTNASKQKE